MGHLSLNLSLIAGSIALAGLFCLAPPAAYAQTLKTGVASASPLASNHPSPGSGSAVQPHTQRSRVSEIRLRVNQMTDKKVQVREPVYGSFFWANQKTVSLDDSGRTTLRLRLPKAGPVTLANGSVYINLYLSPGDKVSVEIHPPDTSQQFIVRGKNSEGQMQLNAKKGYYLFKSNDYLNRYKPTSAALHQIKADLASELLSTNELYRQHKIDRAFLDFATVNSQYYYAAVMAATVKSKYEATHIYPKTSSNYQPSFDQADADAWDGIYEKYPVGNRKALASFVYFDYLSDYLKSYVNRYKAELRGTYKEPGEDGITSAYTLYDKAPLQPSIREFGVASFLLYEALENTYDPKLIAFYRHFSREFPGNPYSLYLKPLIDPIIAFQKKENADFSADQKIFSGYDTVGSLNQLLDSFKGKTVFIDVWATWCGPCKEEFRYCDSLRQFLHANGVEMLYIAMDNDKADTQWKTMIKYYNLAGTHVRASLSLQKELMTRREVTAIPRYFIIDKSGNIAEKDALRPSDKEKLYDQIRGYL